jgi:RNA polymerase sigma factor (sigma-70 family)
MVRQEKVRSRWVRRRAVEEPAVSPSPEDEAIAADFGRRFQAALGELPSRRREVFELVRFWGLSYSEVAATMDLSPQTVANQMTLAHRDLRRLLGSLLWDTGTENPSCRERRSRDG